MQSVVRDMGDKSEIMWAENPKCSGRQLDLDGDKWETGLKSRAQRARDKLKMTRPEHVPLSKE